MHMVDENKSLRACAADATTADQDIPVAYARDTRALLFYLLYASYAHDYQVSLPSIIENLNLGFEVDLQPDQVALTRAAAIIANREQLDTFLKPLLDKWRLERIGVCTHLILWIGLWELMNTATDPKIIINEAIELAKCFAEKDAYRFVNGILDQAVKRLAGDRAGSIKTGND